MSEASGSTEREKVESHHLLGEAEMAAVTVRPQEITRSYKSLLSTKRKHLDYNDEDLLERQYQNSKRFLSEELMAAHLQDLTLSSEGSAFSAPFINPHLPTVLPGERSSSPYPHHLNIKTVASCPQSIESQENRKREPLDLECCLNEDCMDVLMIPSRKRTRVDVGSAETCMSSCVNFKSDTKAMHLSSNHHDGDSMSASLHGIGSLSDLSSIPEEGELTQHTSMTTDTTDTSNSIADSPDSSDTQEDKLNPNSHPTMPISISSLLPSSSQSALSDATQGDKVCSVWLAPELKAGIKTHIDSPLPLSILKEIEGTPKGMEIVPWVGGVRGVRTLPLQSSDKEEKESSQDSATGIGKDSTMETN